MSTTVPLATDILVTAKWENRFGFTGFTSKTTSGFASANAYADIMTSAVKRLKAFSIGLQAWGWTGRKRHKFK